VGRLMAEGEGVEPLALLRCQRRFSRPFADHPAPPSVRALAEGVGIEPTRPLRTGYGLASRRITALPTFRGTTRKIDLMSGANGEESNPRPAAYKAAALPTELRWRASFGFVFGSWRAEYTGIGGPGGIPTRNPWSAKPALWHLELQSLASKASAFASFAIGASWWAAQDSNLHKTSFEEVATADCASGPGNYSPSRYRNRKEMVWAVGFEPTTSRFQAGNSDQAELRPEMVGRGSDFMGADCT
jgi:hypothetical protein